MDLTSIKSVKTLLENHHTKPLKGMGQNFLVHQLTLKKIIEAADINKTDTVLEIGPGIGTLTQELSKHAKEVIAIEKDHGMVKILKETLKDCKNVTVIHGDALQHETPLPKEYKLVANLPYYITSPVIRMFLEMPKSLPAGRQAPTQMVLMVQKEVAQRICAVPPDMSILAISVQFYAAAKIVSSVTKEKFWPVPNVDSAIIKITPNKTDLPVSAEEFFTIVKAGFSHPRKQLANNFLVALNPSSRAELTTGHRKDRGWVNQWLAKNNLEPNRRAETLTVQDWVNLTKSYQQ